MKTMTHAMRIGGILLLGLAFLRMPAEAAVTNAVGWTDSFESYSVGTVLQATNGWSSAITVAGVVTNAPAGANPLVSTNIAAVTDLLNNDIRSSTGGVAVVDMLVMPTWSDIDPLGDVSHQYALCVKTNQHLAIWQHSLTPVVTNKWLELAGSPLVNTGVWTRFTVVLNYSNNLFQVRVNDGSPVTDAAGYQADGVTPNGSWFHMVQTNGVMARLVLGDGGTNYVDDVVVTNRGLTWVSAGFTESVTNNGTIDNDTPLLVTLRYDTFTGMDGDDFTGYVQVESGLPPGLSLVAQRVSASTVALTLTNAAMAHVTGDSVSNLTVRFTDAAFTLGNAPDISGYRNTGLAVVFHDTAVLSYSTNLFQEATPAKDGSINNVPPITITLTNDTFTGADGENYATNAAKLVISGMPAGLTGQVVKVDGTHLEMTLLGNALAHTNFNSTSFTLTFLGGAFVSNTVSGSVSNNATAIQVQYVCAPVLAYSTSTFTELSFGTINNLTPMTITLSGDTFVAGGDFSSWVTVVNLPAGLSAVFTRDSATQLSVTLSGMTTAQASSNTLHNLEFTFEQGAFSQAAASQVVNYSKNDLNVVFVDDLAFVNTVPYREPFEGYPNGFLLAGTNAWTADYYPDSLQITNRPVLMTLLAQYQNRGGTYPIATNHVQTLLVRDSIRNEIHSPTGELVYLDFMMVPVAMQDTPENSADNQFAFYVNTNRQVVIWHRTPTGGDWLVMTNNAPLIDTNAWTRFTVTQNYTNKMFQLRVNEGAPLSDPAGWDASGTAPTGSWFHMVNTNANVMSRFLISGAGTAFVDDLTVVTAFPANFGLGAGSVFKVR